MTHSAIGVEVWRTLFRAGAIITSLAVSARAAAPVRPPLKPVPFTAVQFRDQFWAPRIEINRTVTIPHDFAMCEKTGRITNFARAAGREKGDFQGIFYDDSDVYKVIEGASYSLATKPDPQLDAYLDRLIDTIAAAQQPDGYLYTFYTINGLDQRFTNLKDKHELYCAGHLIEAAVAHKRATGNDSLLRVATKLADHIDSVFGADKRHDIDGHEEIELALFKLADLTGEKRYETLAKFFVDEHGHTACGRKLQGKYHQDVGPVIEQKEVMGHAVRQAYMLCAMTDYAARGDQRYTAAVDRLWDDLVGTKMYVTGGIGARHEGEAFGDAFELPNESAYNETCAAIGNALWNHRMNLLHADGKYFDVVERVLYNGFLSGVSLGGDRFFYVNPLASGGKHHRQEWYKTACCPVNVVRFLPSLPGYAYATRGGGALYVNLYARSDATVDVAGQKVTIAQDTRYPWGGSVLLTITPQRLSAFALHLRVPGWCDASAASASVNGDRVERRLENGYLVIERGWKAGDRVQLALPMPIVRVKSDPRVKANVGRVALQRGPVVYCVEGVDNGGKVSHLRSKPDARYTLEYRGDLLGGVNVIKGDDGVVAVPYYAWDHREAGEMAVWLLEE